MSRFTRRERRQRIADRAQWLNTPLADRTPTGWIPCERCFRAELELDAEGFCDGCRRAQSCAGERTS